MVIIYKGTKLNFKLKWKKPSEFRKSLVNLQLKGSLNETQKNKEFRKSLVNLPLKGSLNETRKEKDFNWLHRPTKKINLPKGNLCNQWKWKKPSEFRKSLVNLQLKGKGSLKKTRKNKEFRKSLVNLQLKGKGSLNETQKNKIFNWLCKLAKRKKPSEFRKFLVNLPLKGSLNETRKEKDFNWLRRPTKKINLPKGNLRIQWKSFSFPKQLLHNEQTNLDIEDHFDSQVEFINQPIVFDGDFWRYQFAPYGCGWESIYSMWNLRLNWGFKTNISVLMPLFINYSKYKKAKIFNFFDDNLKYLFENSFKRRKLFFIKQLPNMLCNFYTISDITINYWKNNTSHYVLNYQEDLFISTFSSKFYELSNNFSPQRIKENLEVKRVAAKAIIVANDQFLSASFIINSYDSSTFYLYNRKFLKKKERLNIFKGFIEWISNCFFNNKVYNNNNSLLNELFIFLDRRFFKFIEYLFQFNYFYNKYFKFYYYYFIYFYNKYFKMSYKNYLNIYFYKSRYYLNNLVNFFSFFSSFKFRHFSLNKNLSKTSLFFFSFLKYPMIKKLPYLFNTYKLSKNFYKNYLSYSDLTLGSWLIKYKKHYFNYNNFIFSHLRGNFIENLEYIPIFKGYANFQLAMYMPRSNYKFKFYLINTSPPIIHKKPSWSIFHTYRGYDRIHNFFSFIPGKYKKIKQFLRYMDLFVRQFSFNLLHDIKKYFGFAYSIIISKSSQSIRGFYYYIYNLKLHLIKGVQNLNTLRHKYLPGISNKRPKKFKFRLRLFLRKWYWFFLSPFKYKSVLNLDCFYIWPKYSIIYNLKHKLFFKELKGNNFKKLLINYRLTEHFWYIADLYNLHFWRKSFKRVKSSFFKRAPFQRYRKAIYFKFRKKSRALGKAIFKDVPYGPYIIFSNYKQKLNSFFKKIKKDNNFKIMTKSYFLYFYNNNYKINKIMILPKYYIYYWNLFHVSLKYQKQKLKKINKKQPKIISFFKIFIKQQYKIAYGSNNFNNNLFKIKRR